MYVVKIINSLFPLLALWPWIFCSAPHVDQFRVWPSRNISLVFGMI